MKPLRTWTQPKEQEKEDFGYQGLKGGGSVKKENLGLICVCIYNDLQQQGNVYSEIPDFLPSYLTDFRECQFTPYCNCSAALCNFISHLIKWILFIFHKSCAGNSSAADSHISHCSQHCSVFYRFNILPSLCGMLISYWAMILLCCPGLWGVWPW